MFEQWRNSRDADLKQQTIWISTIRAVHDKLVEVKSSSALMNGIHELITSIHFMTVTNPMALLNHYPCMASLGLTSKRLKSFCKWNEHLYDTIVQVKIRF